MAGVDDLALIFQMRKLRPRRGLEQPQMLSEGPAVQVPQCPLQSIGSHPMVQPKPLVDPDSERNGRFRKIPGLGSILCGRGCEIMKLLYKRVCCSMGEMKSK